MLPAWRLYTCTCRLLRDWGDFIFLWCVNLKSFLFVACDGSIYHDAWWDHVICLIDTPIPIFKMRVFALDAGRDLWCFFFPCDVTNTPLYYYMYTRRIPVCVALWSAITHTFKSIWQAYDITQCPTPPLFAWALCMSICLTLLFPLYIRLRCLAFAAGQRIVCSAPRPLAYGLFMARRLCDGWSSGSHKLPVTPRFWIFSDCPGPSGKRGTK